MLRSRSCHSRNATGGADAEYLVDGITDSLIDSLSRVRKLRVMARGTVFGYKGRPMDARAVGRELKVDAVLTGSVVRSGERMRIAVQLIHAATDRNLWTNSYERDLRDVLALQREMTRDIVGEIRIKLTPQEQGAIRRSARPVNPEAYDHYLRGQFYLHRQNREDNEAAITALERAVATDPTFAAAHAELAQAYVWKLFLFAPDEKQWEEKAFVAAEKALSSGPEFGRGSPGPWPPSLDARQPFPSRKGHSGISPRPRLNPSLDEARNQLALVYCHIGAFDEALQESAKSSRDQPEQYPRAISNRRNTSIFKGKYEQALSVLRTSLEEVNPALVGHQIALALFNLGRKEEASATIEQFLRDYPEDKRRTVYQRTGDIGSFSRAGTAWRRKKLGRR